jgi:hypothetical protein
MVFRSRISGDRAAVENLQGLGDQFNLANSARTQFDIAAPLIAKNHLLIDLAFHIANVLERAAASKARS